MEMIRLGAGSAARFEFALDRTRSYQFATVGFMRLCASNRAYEVQFRVEAEPLTSHEHRFVRIELHPPEDYTGYHMHEPCDRVRRL